MGMAGSVDSVQKLLGKSEKTTSSRDLQNDDASGFRALQDGNSPPGHLGRCICTIRRHAQEKIGKGRKQWKLRTLRL